MIKKRKPKKKTTSYSEISGSTLQKRSQGLAENVFKNNALLEKLQNGMSKYSPPTFWQRIKSFDWRWELAYKLRRLADKVDGPEPDYEDDE